MENIIEKDRTTLTIRELLREIFESLVINSFGSDCTYDPTQQVQLPQERLVVYPEYYTVPMERLVAVELAQAAGVGGGIVPLRTVVDGLSAMETNFLAYDRDSDFDDQANFVFYQAQDPSFGMGDLFETDINTFVSSTGAMGYPAVAEHDNQRGIYHLRMGSEQGLTKSIGFTRMDQDYLRESRIAAAGELGSFAQLRERYVWLFIPGSLFFFIQLCGLRI